jgi:endonuclease G
MDPQAPAPPDPWGDVSYRQLLTGLRRFLRTDGQRHLDDPNVASIGLGYKVTGGRPTAELSVQFTVEEKRVGPEALAALGTHPVPEAVTVAGVRVPTDVLERRSQPALAAGRSSRTPVASVPRGGDADPTARRRPERGTSAGRPL